MFKTTGTIRYSPKVLGARVSDKWWVILDCDPELGKYYRTLFHLFTYKCYKLERPSWKEHITVVRNEEPSHKEFWEKYDGKELEVTFNPESRTNGHYAWLEVTCEFLLDLRQELGISREPSIPLHLSFGHSSKNNNKYNNID